MSEANEIPHYDIPTVEPVICNVCRHPIELKGEVHNGQYWQCARNCRCLIVQGCIPQRESTWD